MEVIFLLGTVQAAFLSILVFNKKKRSTGDNVLGVWLAFMGLHLLYHYLYSVGFLFNHPHLLGTGSAFSLLEGPFIFVYVVIMISNHGRFRSVYLLHALPFVLFTIYFTFEFYLLNAEEKLEYFEIMYTDMPRDLYIITSPMIFLGPLYVIWSLIKLRRHSENIARDYSYTESINLRWLRNVILFIGIVWITVVLANIFVKFPFLSVDMHEHIQFIALTVAIFFLGYFGIKQQTIYKPESMQSTLPPGRLKQKKTRAQGRYEKSGLKESDAEQHAEALKGYFQEERPFLNGKLSLVEVAEKMELSSNHLSQVINEKLGMSFFDFVNSFRVEETKSRLADPKYSSYTLLAIAFDCGFNSKSSFNSIFKKHTGSTPSAYMKSLAK